VGENSGDLYPDLTRVTEAKLFEQFGPPYHTAFESETGHKYAGIMAYRLFDVVVQTPNDDDNTIWSLLRAKRVYNITKWKDTKIGSKRYQKMTPVSVG
jgi:hypothetical protein